MDIAKIIQELRSERDRVDGIISALEQLHGEYDVVTVKRRGRKFMDKKGRKEVSERMKRYWAERRKQGASASDRKEPSVKAGSDEIPKTDKASSLAVHQAAA